MAECEELVITHLAVKEITDGKEPVVYPRMWAKRACLQLREGENPPRAHWDHGVVEWHVRSCPGDHLINWVLQYDWEVKKIERHGRWIFIVLYSEYQQAWSTRVEVALLARPQTPEEKAQPLGMLWWDTFHEPPPWRDSPDRDCPLHLLRGWA